ncbi:hypothetical protein HYS31_02900 [Candidatus Woesearchaeota archaeon]|nr:hypothetical protein [Candidatus Woesearchaeota archaeon]
METKISRMKKRDGTIVLFDQGKITNAIFRAASSVGGRDKKTAQALSDKVVQELEKLAMPSVEEIQDIVEKVLIENGHASTAKAYILYRQERAALRKEKQLVLEKEEIDEVDKRFDVNALRVLKARYLRKDSTGKLIETPKQLFTRVAVHAALPDIIYDTRIFDINGRQPVNMVEDFKPAIHEDQHGIGKYHLNKYHLEALKRMYDRFNRNKQMKVTWGKFFDMVKKGEFEGYEKNIDELYTLMTHKLFMPNTPAIANFGNPLGMGSACFHPNQPIMTENGPKMIKDVKVGDSVLTHKGRFRNVEKVYTRNADLLYKVNCSKLPKPSMIVTEEHPILCYKDSKIQWLRLNALGEGDYVAMSYPKDVQDAEAIKVSDFVENVHVNEEDKCSYEYKGGKFNVFVHSTKQVKNTVVVDNDLMKLFGYYLSEGSLADNDCVRFTFSADEESYCQEAISIMQDKFGISSRIERTNSESRKWLSLRFHSTILAKFFEKILGRGFDEKSVPSWMLELPQNKQKGLMAGMIRGDGTVFKNYNKTNAKLVMCNQNLVYAFWQMSMRCGVFSALGKESIPKMGTTQPYRCTLSGENGLMLINELFERQETDSGFKPNDLIVNGVTFTKIDQISEVEYYGPVYNLEVEEDHSYVANMVSVHNCFVLDVPDSIEGIMETLKNTAVVFKAGGGMGYNFSKLRPEGDFVSSTGGVASGPLSFMRLFDTMTEVIKQGGCVATDTMVRTDKGIVPMIDMLNSPPLRDNLTDYFVYDGNEYNYAWLAQNNGIASVYTIETELGNELKATGNHLMAVATSNGIEWKRVDSIKEGDWLVIILGGHQGKKIELPRIEKQHHNSNPLKIPEFLNAELAELLGLYVSDGCFNRGRLIISVDARDKDLITRIGYLVQTVFGLGIGEKRDKVTYFDLVFFSKTLEKFFNELRWMKHRSWNAFVPNEIFRSEEPVVSAFLRGLFEGDGSIHPDGYPILYSSSKTLIDQAQQLLLSLGIVAKAHKVTQSEERYGKRQMYKIIILTDKSVNIFKKNIGFISQKKKKLFEQYSRDKKIEYSDLIPTYPTIFSKYYERVGRGSAKGRAKKGANIAYYRDVYHYLKNDRTLTRTKLQKLMKKHQFLNDDKILSEFSSDSKFFTRVTNTSNGLETYTMEIEVPSTSSYIANGLLVHNIRRGANMGILNSNHPDIEKFITAKEGNKGLRNFNISVLIMPDFWEHYDKNEPYPLVNPKDGQIVKYVNPRLLFDKIVYQAWESAEPGVIFFDKVNEYNPFFEYLGPIVTTNPCVVGDTLIPTEAGLITIKELAEKYPNGGINIKVDQRIQNGNLFLRGIKYISHFRAFKTGKKETIRLITKSGKELKCTPDHRILTINGWKAAEELTSADSILADNEAGEDYLDRIEANGIEEVYDITEPITHSFIANGIVVHNCGEVLLYPNEPCNLGSINVWAFAKNDDEGNAYVDWEALKEATFSCTRFLDNVIDVNNFPLKQIEEMSLATRKIGLGVMGVADLLYELRLPYNSEEGRKFMEKLMEFIAYWSKVESIKLAQLRGNLPYYNKSFYKEGKLPIRGPYVSESSNFNWDKISQDTTKYGIRNGYTTIIAPTGSISMIAGCSSGMEPVYSLVFEKNVKVGSFYYVDPAAEKVLKEEGLYNDKLMEDINQHKGSIQNLDYVPKKIRNALVTAMDITPEDHIRALASFQKWVDSSISKTNNFPADATLEHMRDSYILAYRLGCKDVTVFRDSSIKDQVLVAPKAKEEKQEAKIDIKPEQKKMVKESESGLVFAGNGNGSGNGNGGSATSSRHMTKATIKNCPECGTLVELKEGCLHCPGCGWGLCM